MVDLTQIGKATETDKHYKMDQWALMFKATTWEELNMLAAQNPIVDEAVTHIFKLTQEDQIRMQMEAREEYYRNERTHQVLLDQANAKLKKANAKLTEKDSEIAELKAKLAAAGLE